jgi:hypothetical protein
MNEVGEFLDLHFSEPNAYGTYLTLLVETPRIRDGVCALLDHGLCIQQVMDLIAPGNEHGPSTMITSVGLHRLNLLELMVKLEDDGYRFAAIGRIIAHMVENEFIGENENFPCLLSAFLTRKTPELSQTALRNFLDAVKGEIPESNFAIKKRPSSAPEAVPPNNAKFREWALRAESVFKKSDNRFDWPPIPKNNEGKVATPQPLPPATPPAHVRQNDSQKIEDAGKSEDVDGGEEIDDNDDGIDNDDGGIAVDDGNLRTGDPGIDGMLDDIDAIDNQNKAIIDGATNRFNDMLGIGSDAEADAALDVLMEEDKKKNG